MKNLNDFLNILVDTYGNNKNFSYEDLILLALKFSKNDNQLKKRGRPKKNKEEHKSFWELIMHKYSCTEPTRYNKIHIDNNNVVNIHCGVIGMENNIERIELSNIDECYKIIDYINSCFSEQALIYRRKMPKILVPTRDLLQSLDNYHRLSIGNYSTDF